MIYLSELNESCKGFFKTEKSLRKTWNSILGVARATIVTLYYNKQKHKMMDEQNIVRIFNRHLDAVRVIARNRGSKTQLAHIPTHFLENPFRRKYSWFVKQAIVDARDETETITLTRTVTETETDTTTEGNNNEEPETENPIRCPRGQKHSRQLYTTKKMFVAVEQVLHDCNYTNFSRDFSIKLGQALINGTCFKTTAITDTIFSN